MITAHQLEVRAGARLLMEDVSFRVAAGDKVGLVGRNGAGKTTLTKILAGEALPAAGTVHSTGTSATSPRTRAPATPTVLARERILSARGLDDVVRRLREAEDEMGSDDPEVRERAMRRYERADAELHAGGGYAAESEAAQIASQPRHRGPDPRPAAEAPCRGGQRRRVELARILFSGAETLLLDEPTNHLDADSIVWLRDFLKSHKGGLVVISHDTAPARGDRQQGAAPRRQPGRDRRLQHGLEGLPPAARDRREAPQARADERREQGEDAHRPGQPDARQGHQGAGGAVDAQARREADGRRRGRAPRRPGRPDQVPRARAVRQDAAHRRGAVEVLRLARGLHRRRPRDRQGLAGRHPRPQRRRQDHAAADPRRRRRAPTPARSCPGHGLKLGYYAQEHETLDTDRTVLENLQQRGAAAHRHRGPLGARRRSCSPATTPTSRPGCCPAARRPGWRWPSWSSPAPTCCCSTSPPTTSTPPPARRCSPRSAPTRARSSWSPTTRARCSALEPDRVLILPDGVEDLWNEDYADLVVASPDRRLPVARGRDRQDSAGMTRRGARRRRPASYDVDGPVAHRHARPARACATPDAGDVAGAGRDRRRAARRRARRRGARGGPRRSPRAWTARCSTPARRRRATESVVDLLALTDAEMSALDRRLPARASPGCATRASSASPRCRATPSAPASSSPSLRPAGARRRRAVLHEGVGAGPGAGPDGNKTAGRGGWLRQSTGDLRDGTDGRRRGGRGHRAGARPPSRPTELDATVADLVAALTARSRARSARPRALLLSAAADRPRRAAPARARGAGPAVPGAGWR